MSTRTVAHFSPGRVVFTFTFITILIGTLLLALPFAQKSPLGLLDLFFTATSSTCVTGMFTIPLSQFTTFGHCVILGLIQIGGIGLVTLTLFTIYLLFDLGFGAQLLAGQIFEIESWKQIKKILIFIMSITLITELIGTACTFLCIKSYYPAGRALFLAFFHSVSSFCNAGVSLFEHGKHPDLLIANTPLLLVTAVLMFAGSFGFITWSELARNCRARYLHKRYSFSLVTKLVISGTVFLILIPSILLFALEYNHAFAGLPLWQKIINAFYNAISLRSTGLLTIPVAAMQKATLMLIMVVAFIGAAPASTGSGVKITTFIIWLATIKTIITGDTTVNIKGRRIAKEQVLKALAIISLSACWIISTLFCLLLTQKNASFLDVAVETVSAITNLGLTTGLTPVLTWGSKILIMISMIIGRIGSLTLIIAFIKPSQKISDLIK